MQSTGKGLPFSMPPLQLEEDVMHTVSRCGHNAIAELTMGVEFARRYLPLSRPALAASAAPVHTVSRYGHEPLLSSTDGPYWWRKLMSSLFSTSFLVPKPPVPSTGHPFKLESMLFSLTPECGSWVLVEVLPSVHPAMAAGCYAQFPHRGTHGCHAGSPTTRRMSGRGHVSKL